MAGPGGGRLGGGSDGVVGGVVPFTLVRKESWCDFIDVMFDVDFYLFGLPLLLVL